MIFSSVKFRKSMRKLNIIKEKNIRNINSSIEDSIAGIRVVKSFSNESIERTKFENTI